MKFAVLKTISLLIAGSFLLHGSFASAKDGAGNGGDGYVDEFTGIARSYYIFLKNMTPEERGGVDPEEFIRIINTFTISSTPEVLFIAGIPKDVINYPRQKRIDISRPRWDSLPDRLKVRLVPHEIYGAMGKDDSHYELSSPLVAQVLPGFLNREEGLPALLRSVDLKSYCTDVDGILNFALTNAALAHTYDAEAIILVSGIKQALALGDKRNHRFFGSTLHAALADYEVISEEKAIQVFFLRNQIRSALEDLKSLDTIALGKDFGPYVKQVLSRSQDIAATSRNSKEETTILARSAKRAITFLDGSDYGRTAPYACSMHTLIYAVDVSDDDSMSYQAKALVMRASFTEAIRELDKCR